MVEQTGDVFGKRYGEVLLVHIGESGPEADVYNSFPLNDCPAELWDKLGCPYDAALALFDSGTECGLRDALRRFDALGHSLR